MGRLGDDVGVGREIMVAVEEGGTGTADGRIAVEVAIAGFGVVEVVDCRD